MRAFRQICLAWQLKMSGCLVKRQDRAHTITWMTSVCSIRGYQQLSIQSVANLQHNSLYPTVAFLPKMPHQFPDLYIAAYPILCWQKIRY